MTINNSKLIKIVLPVTNQDILDSVELIRQTLYWEKGLDKELRNLSTGEMLLAKDGRKIVGVLSQRRPGKIFNELPEDYFDLNEVKFPKKDIGHIVTIVVDQTYQGKGIGKRLITKALGLQKDFGSKVVTVHCWKSSPGNASEKLFRSFGFRPLKLFKRSWEKHSKKVGPEEFICASCGNPCVCDDLLMVKYFK